MPEKINEFECLNHSSQQTNNKMKKNTIKLMAAGLMSFAGIRQGLAQETISGQHLARHIEVLASDEFEGRKPFTSGEVKTINYLKQSYEKLGLKPGNGKSYFQKVPMVEIFSKAKGQLHIKGKNGNLAFNFLDDFVAATRRVQEDISIKDSPLVFAGFGIVAPEYQWNDYAGLNVKGKTVVVMVNDPGFYDPALFKCKRMTYYGRWTYKFEEAARQGATGIIIVHDTKAASYGWPVVRSGWSKSKLYLQRPDNNKSRAAIEGWISAETASKVFKLAGFSDDLLEKAKKKGFKPVNLGLTASLSLHNAIKKSTSNNVAALLPGTTKADEVIIYSAHWDHFGKGEAIKGDSIYNGAADNASGTAAVLAIAEAFTNHKKKPARSILFLSVTGEEQGLLGSEYYATHPIFPLGKTVADINLDVLQPFGKMKDVIVMGYGQSELDDYAKEAAAQQGRIVRGEPDASGGWYFRSDHFNFAKVGIPALYIENGTQSLEDGEEWGNAKKEDYNKNRYHSPFDEYSPHWDMSGIVEDATLLFNIGNRLSNETTFPKWKKGSEFKAIRGKYKK